MSNKVEVSNGELVDKYVILLIKAKKMPKNVFVKEECSYLKKKVDKLRLSPEIISQLTAVNSNIWDLEDLVRNLEAQHRFDERFISAAREIYHQNDKRFLIKSLINEITNSKFKEQKSLPKY